MRAQRTKLLALLLGNIYSGSQRMGTSLLDDRGRRKKRKRHIDIQSLFRNHQCDSSTRCIRHRERNWDFVRLCWDCWRIVCRLTTTCLVSKCKILVTCQLHERCLFCSPLFVQPREPCLTPVPPSTSFWTTNEQGNRRTVVCEPKSRDFVLTY